MADDKRLRILKALTAELELITEANGYQHDLSGKVFRGRTAFGDSDPDLLVTILERPAFDADFVAGGQSTANLQEWELVVQGYVLAERSNPTDPAYLLLADCKKALSVPALIAKRQQQKVLDGLVHDIIIYPGVVLPPDSQASTKHAQFILQIVLKIVDNADSPY